MKTVLVLIGFVALCIIVKNQPPQYTPYYNYHEMAKGPNLNMFGYPIKPKADTSAAAGCEETKL
jgi:hypothetical protein